MKSRANSLVPAASDDQFMNSYSDDDNDCCFTATFVHMTGKMGRVTSKGNDAKPKMKHPLNIDEQ